MPGMKVVILYRSSLRLRHVFRRKPILIPSGSDFMRAAQLVGLLRPHLAPDIRLGAWPYHVTHRGILAYPQMQLLRGSLVILLKNVAYKTPPCFIDGMRETAVAVGVDHIDGDLGAIDLTSFDFHICASNAGYRVLSRVLGGANTFVGQLFHHGDPRLLDVRREKPNRLQAVYLGRPENLGSLDLAGVPYDALAAGTDREMRSALRRLGRYNLHLAVRPRAPSDDLLRVYKPFTKGANAASCGANIMVRRDEDDAEYFLGADYPYLIGGTISAHDAYLRASETFGGPIWQEALDRMTSLAEKVHPRALARQFETIVRSVA